LLIWLFFWGCTETAKHASARCFFKVAFDKEVRARHATELAGLSKDVGLDIIVED
jgi:hypothetical protein